MHASASDPLAHATRLVQAGALSEARQIVRRSLAEQPGSAPGLTLAGHIAVRRSDLIDAVRNFDRAVRAGSADDPRALLNLARAQVMTGRAAEALLTVRAALAKFPDDSRVRGAVAVLLLGAGRSSDAARLLRPRDTANLEPETALKIGLQLAPEAPLRRLALDLLQRAATLPGPSLLPANRALATWCPTNDPRSFKAARRTLVLCPDDFEAIAAVGHGYRLQQHFVRRAAWIWQRHCIRPDDDAQLALAAEVTYDVKWPGHGLAANIALLARRPEQWDLVGRICALYARDRELSPDKAAVTLRAISWARSIIAAEPKDARVWDAVAGMLKDVEAFEEAEALWPQIIRRFPRIEALHYNRGLFLDELGRLDAATRSLRIAIALKPDYQKATNILSLVSARVHDLHAAVRYVQHAIASNPNTPSCWVNYGSHLRAVGRYDEALTAFAAAERIARSRNDTENESAGCYNRAMTYVSLGELELGFQLMESRWATRGFPSPKRKFRQTIWRGPHTHPHGRLLVYMEQGLGDEVMMSWYFPMLRRDTQRLVVDCDARLVDVFTRTYEGIEFVPRSVQGHPVTREPSLQYKLPILHAPQYYVTELKLLIRANPEWAACHGSRFPARLLLEEQRLRRWDHWLEERYPGRPRLSLSWRSKMRNRTRDQQYVALDELAQALPAGAVAINLQYSSTSEELDELSRLVRGRDIEVVTPEGVDLTNDLDDIFAILQVSDAAVTPMISLAWMAAAVGCPAFVFRTSRERSIWHQFGTPFVPWAPSMRLFFRDPSENWNAVIKDMHEGLKRFLTNRPERLG